MADALYRSRWAPAGVAVGAVLAFSGAALFVRQLSAGWSWPAAVQGILFVVLGVRQSWTCRRNGVVVSDEGLTVRSSAGPNGHWRWHELDRVEVYLDPTRKNPPEEIEVITTAGETLLLGRLARRRRLFDDLRARLQRPAHDPA